MSDSNVSDSRRLPLASEITRFIDKAPFPIVGIDRLGRIMEWNHALEVLTGRQNSEVVGQPVKNQVVDLVDERVLMNAFQRSVEKRTSEPFNVRLQTVGCKPAHLLMTFRAQIDAKGSVVGVLGAGQDVNELESLKLINDANKHELLNLFETANAPVFGTDRKGRVNQWNRKLEAITGRMRETMLGTTLVGSPAVASDHEHLSNVIEGALSGDETDNYEITFRSPQGDRVELNVNFSTRRDASNMVNGLLAVGQDLTDIRRSEARLAHASTLATLGEMTTSLAHELNQPLNVIRLTATNLIDRLESSETDLDHLLGKLSRINAMSERAASIIERMRVFVRQPTAPKALINVDAAVKGALDVVSEQLELAKIEVSVELASEDLVVLGDQLRFEQVLINLLINARDAIIECSEGPRQIHVGGKLEVDDTLIQVWDTGAGFKETVVDRALQPFFTTKPVGKGTGLGLAVSYGIIREMDGEISLSNHAQGAEVTIRIPTPGARQARAY